VLQSKAHVSRVKGGGLAYGAAVGDVDGGEGGGGGAAEVEIAREKNETELGGGGGGVREGRGGGGGECWRCACVAAHLDAAIAQQAQGVNALNRARVLRQIESKKGFGAKGEVRPEISSRDEGGWCSCGAAAALDARRRRRVILREKAVEDVGGNDVQSAWRRAAEGCVGCVFEAAGDDLSWGGGGGGVRGGWGGRGGGRVVPRAMLVMKGRDSHWRTMRGRYLWRVRGRSRDKERV